jgi:hypothetical protein
MDPLSFPVWQSYNKNNSFRYQIGSPLHIHPLLEFQFIRLFIFSSYLRLHYTLHQFMMRYFTVFTVLSFPLAWASPHFQRKQNNCTIGQIVDTSSGPVAGHGATDYPKVSEYLGIPYGQAPVGNLRFAAPVKYNGSSMLNGSVYVSYRSTRSHVT